MEKVPVLVTTQHRGVFFGYADPERLMDPHVELHQCRNCIYWSSDVGGFLGLAKSGPKSGCRIGTEVPSFIARDVTGVARCTTEAAAAWTTFK